MESQHKKWSFIEALAVGVVLTFVSCALSWVGTSYGRAYVPAGQGYPQANEIQRDLFRFDSAYYLDIAEHGYSYNGDPGSSPNIVFAPLFPLSVGAIAKLTGWSAVDIGFLLNHLLLWGALTLLFSCLRHWFGAWPALASLFALVTSAGSYSLHAYYSECAMLFCLALCLRSVQRGWWFRLALACAFLGASRTAALPMVAVFSALLMARAYNLRKMPRMALKFALYSLLCGAGGAGYLLYIGFEFGEPLTLLSTIQKTSWGLFHQETSWFEVLSGGYLFTYWTQALSKGLATFSDIKTLNLLWTTLSIVACAYSAWHRPRHIITFLFIPYFALIYWTGAASDFLISVHRFSVIMLPIYFMFTDLHERLAQRSRAVAWMVSLPLLLINIGYGIFHAAYFNQGVWYYF